MNKDPITIVGAGIIGIWQALTLAQKGFKVTLLDRDLDPLANSSSRHAGALLSPWTENESSPDIVREMGILGIKEWCRNYPEVIKRGCLTVAAPRDENELSRFARMTNEHKLLDRKALGHLEPQIAERFNKALFFSDEAHLVTPHAMEYLLQSAKKLGVSVILGKTTSTDQQQGFVVDCRGFSAHNRLKNLRGVRGERLLVRSEDIVLSRPIRLLHPRHSIYIVPWSEGRYIIGATMIESEESGPVTVRSALELLGAAYAVHPAFGEAQILEMTSAIRPAFPDNVPRVEAYIQNKEIFVNGAYRHGFLLAPVLSKVVAEFLLEGTTHPFLRYN